MKAPPTRLLPMRSFAGRCGCQLMVAACLVLGLSVAARGQSAPATSQPAARPVSGPSRNFFSLERLDGALELTAEYEQRRVRIRDRFFLDGTRQRNLRQSFDQQFTLDFGASLWDPNLVSLSGGLAFGLTQERFRETFNRDADTDTNRGRLTEYDLHLDFLRGRKLSGSAYGLKTQDRFSRAFLPSLREERNDYGFALYWTDDRLPMELTFDHRAVDRSGSRRNLDDENLNEDRLRYQTTWITSPNHSLRFTYEFSRDEERFSGSRTSFDNIRNQFRFNDELLFGPQHEHRLDTVIRYQDEQGDYARDLLEIGPRVSLHHSDSLTTQYQYQFSREEVGDLQIDIHRGDWQLIHQLYQNLTTTVNLFGIKERVENDTETLEFGGLVDWSYARKNRYGHFSANLSLTAESERTRGGGLRAMVGESGAFLDPLPIILSRDGILPWTLVVRNAAFPRIYIQGLDYFVSRAGGRTVLLRNPLGGILNATSVRIDYLYRVDSNGSRDDQRVDFRVQQDFDNGWTPYYSFEFRHDERDVRSAIFRSRDFESDRHRLGVKYRKGRFNAGGELEILKDTIDPFVAYRVYASSNLLRRRQTTVDVRADFSHYFFEASDRDDTMILELSLDGRAALSRASDAYLTSTYRFEDDGTRGRGINQGVDLESGLSYKWGLFTFTASVEYDLLTIDDAKEDGMTVFLRVRRDFPNLLGLVR